MSAFGFPETPKGSPGGIRDAAESLTTAAEGLDTSSTTLSQTATALSGVAWSGPAQARFTGAAAGLGQVCDGAQEALRTCAGAARSYASELETAQKVIEREREEFEQAVIDQTSAAGAVGRLTSAFAGAKPEEQAGLGNKISDARDLLEGATDRRQAALTRARRARDEFDRAERKAIGLLSGSAPGSSSALGSQGVGSPFSSPATYGPFGMGGGFGVPIGGLSRYNGVVPLETSEPGEFDEGNSKGADYWGISGAAYDSYLTSKNQGFTEPDDLTVAGVTAATFWAGGSGGLLVRGASAARSGVTKAGSRVSAGVRSRLASEESRVAALEGAGGIIERAAGVPFAEAATQLASPVLRSSTRIYVREMYAEVRRNTASNLATLRAARAISQGSKRVRIPREEVDRLARLSGRAR